MPFPRTFLSVNPLVAQLLLLSPGILFPLLYILPNSFLTICFARVLRLQIYPLSFTMFSSLALPAASLLLAGLHAVTVGAVPTISAVGSKFFYENGSQYYIKGTWMSPA